MPDWKKLVLKIRIRKPSREKRERIFRITGRTCLFLLAAFLGLGFGTYYAVTRNLPDVEELEHFEPYIITSVLGDDGRVVKEFAVERRLEVPYEKIPQVLLRAVIATEDPRFFGHRGVDLIGILRAVKENVFGRREGKPQGGSTITQQLATSLFLRRELTLRRKLKEAVLSLRVERRYSKTKILEMYCNQFYFGHGVYGVESAAHLFFGKSVADVTLEEAAMLAGIFRGPSIYSPYNAPQLMLQRRNHVLRRMMDAGAITRAQAEESMSKPLAVLPLRRASSDFGAYFFEEVRRYVEKTYGYDALYRQGLKITTTFNAEMQAFAESAVDRQLRSIDKSLGWRKDKRNLLGEGRDVEEVWLEAWTSSQVEPGTFEEAVVLAADKAEALVRVKKYRGRLGNKDIAWTKTRNLDQLLKPGDVIQVALKSVDEEKKEFEASLEQEPEVEAAFLAVVPQTGEVKAMIGGHSFRKSEFNRATQALRQAGSAIKPFLYTAALETGFTASTRLIDEPTDFVDKWSGQAWSPLNYDRLFKGAVTLRKGLEESRNIVTAKVLESISPQTGVNACRKFGLTSTIYPYLSLSLGTFEVTLLELLSAYTVFPNRGVRVEPYFIARIEDKAGNLLEEAKVEVEEVIPPQTAYLMTYMMQGVTAPGGTGWSAGPLTRDKPLAGKTGTTDDFSDAWMLGFSPSLCAGVWVGRETKMEIAPRHSGAVAAQPIWNEFFKKVIEAEKARAAAEGREPTREEFAVPPNIVFIDIDKKTGYLAAPSCLWPFREAFLAGTGPTRFCTMEDHMMTLDYYGTDKAKEERD
ncbi:MAG: PBP1A family penicillin-binding protein [Candidatus Aminicenantes bacterium]|nr:PBP1A family penicillin-binding protein [Candidatus Aminicenantes bacterium]